MVVSKQETLTQCWHIAWPALATLARQYSSIGSASPVCRDSISLHKACSEPRSGDSVNCPRNSIRNSIRSGIEADTQQTRHVETMMF